MLNLSEFSPEAVFARMVEQAKQLVDRANANRLMIYERHVSDVKLNWERLGRRVELYDPPTAMAYKADPTNYTVEIYDTGIPLCEKPVHPADIPQQPEAKDKVVVGPMIDPLRRIYAAYGSTVAPGYVTTIEGAKYKLVQIGQPGMIFYSLLWVPVES